MIKSFLFSYLYFFVFMSEIAIFYIESILIFEKI